MSQYYAECCHACGYVQCRGAHSLPGRNTAIKRNRCYLDTTSFGQTSICQMSFSQHIVVISVGQNVRTSNITTNRGWKLS